MSVDDTVSKGIEKILREFDDAERRAGTSSGLAMIGDAVNESPTPPVDTGNLRGSGFVASGGQITHTGPDTSVSGSVTTQPGEFEVQAGFNTPYAKFQHEGLPPGPGVKMEDGSVVNLSPGPKSLQAGDVGGLFLSSKLAKNAAKYMQIFADRLGRNLGLK